MVQRSRKSKISILSVVWFIPVVAILTGLWLAYNYYHSLGTEIILHINNAEGIQVDNTVLKVLNVEVGHIASIRLAPDGKGVDMKAYVQSDTKGLFAEDAHYWVMKPMIAKGGVSGLNTLISGSYIAIRPGKSNHYKREFTVSDIPPALAQNTKGTTVNLIGKDTDSLLSSGSAVLYHGIQVGVVESSYFDVHDKQPHYRIFIYSPNDQLVGKNVRFWVSFGVSIDSVDGGLKIRGLRFDNLVGSISFSEPEGMDKGGPIPSNYTFTLYNDKSALPPSVPKEAFYVVGFFDQDLRNLGAGAPVRYKGMQVGRVLQVPFFHAGDLSGLLKKKTMPVLLYVDPRAFGFKNHTTFASQFQQAIRRGLVATLASDNLLTGARYVYLYERKINDYPVYPAKNYDGKVVIGTTTSGLDSVLESLNALLAKLKGTTLDKVDNDLDQLRQSLRSLQDITEDIHREGTIKNINATLHGLQDTLKSVSPTSTTYKELNRIINDLQQLTQQIKEQPNQLIFKNKRADPVPGGK